MKILTISEALIALGNGEKVTSDWCDNTLRYVHLQGEKVTYDNGVFPSLKDFLGGGNLRIYEEFTYPMWFKNSQEKISKFVGLRSRIDLSDGYATDSSAPHTESEHWQQVEEPKKMIKVAKYAYFESIHYLDTNTAKNRWTDDSERYYIDDEDFVRNTKVNHQRFKRLDYTEIEVEDYAG